MISSRGHFLTNSIYGMYSSATSGEMRSSSMLLVVMWNLQITVLNSRTLEEYWIWHSFSLADADVGIIYNCVNHYSAAGECWSPCWLHCFIYWSRCCSHHFVYIRKLVALLVSLYGRMSGHLAIFLICFSGHLAGLPVH